MESKPDKRQRLLALAGTLLFHAAIVAVLLLTWLFPAVPTALAHETAEPEDGEILLGSEYVIAGDVDVLSDDASANTPATSVTRQDDAGRDGVDLSDAGEQGEASPTLTSKVPSPAKAPLKPVPEKPGSKNKNASDAKARDKAAADAAERVSKRTNFSRDDNNAAPKGNTGSPDGNADHGASAGTPGFYLAGRTMASWSKPSATATGTIVINVKVDREGHVTSATYGKGSGPVASSAAARNSCLAAARASRFSVSEDAPAQQSGTITYRFK